MSFRDDLEVPGPILEIARTLEQAGFEAWCVGGSLRDALLGHPQSDYDIATSATPDQVQGLFKRTVAVGIKYGTVGVFDRQRVLHEVTTFRQDVSTDGRHAVVAYGVTLEQDLARRDFTINAIAYHPLRREWRDPFSGADDLRAGVVRAVGEPSQRFQEDYLRILRALRFAARFEFEIEPQTWEAARQLAPALNQLSAERVKDEWYKSLRSARSISRLVSLWQEVGAARVWLPELNSAVPRQLPPPPNRDPVLLTALLCSDPVAVLKRLKASNAELERARGVSVGPEAPSGTDEHAVRRWLARTGRSAEDLTAMWALRRGQEAPWAETAQAIRQRGDALSRSELAVDGSDLESLGLTGPSIGRTLGYLLDRVLEDPSLNAKEKLLDLARNSK